MRSKAFLLSWFTTSTSFRYSKGLTQTVHTYRSRNTKTVQEMILSQIERNTVLAPNSMRNSIEYQTQTKYGKMDAHVGVYAARHENGDQRWKYTSLPGIVKYPAWRPREQRMENKKQKYLRSEGSHFARFQRLLACRVGHSSLCSESYTYSLATALSNPKILLGIANSRESRTSVSGRGAMNSYVTS